MPAIFRPAIAVMNRLRYPQKFMLVGLLLLVPLIITLFQFVTKINEDINFSSKERIGLIYNEPVMDLLQLIQRHATYSAGVLNGEFQFQSSLVTLNQSIDIQIARVRDIDRQYGDTLQARDLWREISAAWTDLKNNHAAMTPEASISAHDNLIGEILNLIVVVANRSNLILDPQIDSYYLMDTLVNQLPEAARSLSDMRTQGVAAGVRSTTTSDDNAQLRILSGLVISTLDTNQQGFAYVFEASPRLMDSLQEPFTAMRTGAVAAVNVINEDVLNGQRIRGQLVIDPLAIYEDTTAGIDGIFAFYDQVSPALDQLLLLRIDDLVTRRTLVLVVSSVALAGAVYLFIGFYLAVRNAITALEQTTQRMVSGDVVEEFKLASRDELAQVGVSFNQIANEMLRARDQALEASRAKSTFLANMSHELRTPLNAIIGYSELIEEELTDLGEDEFVPDLHKIQGAAKHLLALINDILDLSKIEAGKMDLFIEAIDIETMIEDVISTAIPLAEKNQNQLKISHSGELGTIHTDLTKVRQVLFNLLSNASKFTREGTITLRAEREIIGSKEMVVFKVIDTGIGMTEEQLDRLFQDFVQADSSTTRKYGGTGLGLSISKRFCQMLGGDIEATSEVGVGSTFIARILANLPKPGELLDTGTMKPVALPPNAKTVLVIDDDPAVRDLVTRFLGKEGFNVQTANGGIDGLRRARELRPDVITLDVMMPGMDGWAVLGALKADAELSKIPVVMMTIVSEQNLGYALGASDYLTKPIDYDRLIGVLRKYEGSITHKDVLVVEDDEATREVLVRLLKKERYTVREAADGQIALERVAEHAPEIILLDLMMPNMDGFQFLEEFRKQPAWQGIPVVVITAMELTTEDRQRLNGEVQQVIQKGSYSQEQLLAQVRKQVAALTGQH